MPATYFPFRWMVGTFQEILDSSSGNWLRIKSITDLRVLPFVGSCEAKYSSTNLTPGAFISFRLLLRPICSKQVVEGRGLSIPTTSSGPDQEWSQTKQHAPRMET